LRVHRVGGEQLRKTAIPDDSYNVQQAHGWVVTPGLGTGTLCALDRRGPPQVAADGRALLARRVHRHPFVTIPVRAGS
jgi:hypothetical protein